MSELSGLISWDEVENKGKIPNSEWICPQANNLDELFRVTEENNGVVTDENVLRYGAGRSQHLELLQYPEGYHATHVVDSETGEKLTSERATESYSHIPPCSPPFGTCPGGGGRQNFLNKIFLVSDDPEENRAITYVDNDDDGTTTLIASKMRNVYRSGEAFIKPGAQYFHLQADGFVSKAAIPDEFIRVSHLITRLGITQHGNSITMSAKLAMRRHFGNGSCIEFSWDSAGHMDITGHEDPEILDILGVKHKGRVTAELAINALHKAANMPDDSANIDVSKTAQALYKHIGEQEIEPLSMIQTV